MYGTISTWFYKHLAGIQQVQDGFEKLHIAPKLPTDMKYASASVQTIRGSVSSSWNKTVQGLEINLEIPFGSTVVFDVPHGYTSVYENEKCLFMDGIFYPVNGISAGVFADGIVKLTLGSGKYHFIAR
jgi:alpha-L-rhamnosidase